MDCVWYNRDMVRVYTTPTCAYCHALMNWLDEEGIEFEEHDAFEREDITGVPVTDIDTKDGPVEILGFDRLAIKEALRNAE